MVRCSVIIPVYDKIHLTQQCLGRLLTAQRRPDLEIIVVDDGSRDRTPQVLAGYGEQVRVLRHDRNQGFATGCNNGAALAVGEYLVFLNNDTIPLDGWLDALVRYADAHPKTGAVGAKMLYPDGTIQHAGMVVGHAHHPYHVYAGFPMDHRAVNRSRPFQMVTGGCMLVPRAVFATAKGFDTAFINGYEDVDLCLRLGQSGYEIHYCHESELFHLEAVSEGRLDHEEKNARIFRERWSQRVVRDDVRYFLEDGLLEIIQHSLHVELRLSPLLGIVNLDSRADAADSLLIRRAEQVYRLLKENTTLRAANAASRASVRAKKAA